MDHMFIPFHENALQISSESYKQKLIQRSVHANFRIYKFPRFTHWLREGRRKRRESRISQLPGSFSEFG